jgi:uncharacterized protein YbjT (DUF2867 family)
MTSTTTSTQPEVDRRLFAVVGATGQQGGATARALLAAGQRVRALVRNPQAAAAQKLVAAGAEVARADLAGTDSLRAGLAGVDGVFAMTTMAGPDGTEGEVADGRRIADAVRDVAVPRFVYSSVGGADRHTGIPHFESKRRVEEYIGELGLPAVVVRPTFFMSNFAGAAAPQQADGELVLRSPLTPGVPLQMIAVEDVGSVAAAALLDPGQVPGGSIEIAGDELTAEEIAAGYGEQAGLPARFEALPLSVLDSDPDLQAMFAWFGEVPAYQADFAVTRALAPDVKDFPTWLSVRR